MFAAMRLLGRVFLTVLNLLLLCLPLYVSWSVDARRMSEFIRQRAFALGCLIWGVHVKTQGQCSSQRPLLVVSNHFSYLDVFALGSVAPMRFTPKSEVAGWPFIGFYSKIMGCLFIDRRPSQTLHNKRALHRAIQDGEIISLFPEGTTNQGTHLLPFKSSFFSIVEGEEIMVQPVSVAYTALNGKPIDAAARPVVGWYDDMSFFPHVMRFLCQRSVDVTLVFHAPVSGHQFASRKELARHCQDIIASSFA